MNKADDQKPRLQRRRRQGFTLIEMLVVVSVIGILVSAAGFHNTRVLKKSKDTALMHELSMMRTAVYQYALQHNGRFPPSLQDLAPAFINRVPAGWRGSNADGSFHYEPTEGVLSLYPPDAGDNSAVDAGGRKYADY